jgi:hypothetical protein
MEEEIKGLKSLLESLAEKAQAQTRTHLTPEKLVDYYLKKMSLGEAEEVEEHLVFCRQCTSLGLTLAAFCNPPEEEANQLAREERDAAWLEWQTQTQTSPPTSPPLPASKASAFQRFGGWFFWPRSTYALAVVSLLITLLCGFWLISLNRQNQSLIAQLNQGQSARNQEHVTAQAALAESEKKIAEAQRQRDEAQSREKQTAEDLAKIQRQINEPQLNVPIEEFMASQRTTGDKGLSIKIRAGTPRFTLIIPVPASSLHYPDYALEITNQQGSRILYSKGLRLDPAVGFTVSLSGQQFINGKYHFRIFGLRRGKRIPLTHDIADIRRE